MLKDNSFDSYTHVQALKTERRKKDITYFRDFFEPIYQFSGAEVDIAYGLTFYDKKYRPFKEFEKQGIPVWWDSYNHVKHSWFECIEEATLANVIGGLAGLFLLNVLHKESLDYLVAYQDVLVADFKDSFPKNYFRDLMKVSMIGVPKNWSKFNFLARTPLFTHVFRIDEKSTFPSIIGQ